ncbi:MAG TPA: hypothetical protein VLH08_21590 [Acidobacteriota bacterium]|nr:hypothetical protein [Acidobacteriota bacterium]
MKRLLVKGFLITSIVFGVFANVEAAKVIYPGAAPCNGTLQDCVDQGVDEGDTLLINTNQVDEDLNIDKSLTIAPAPGFHSPVIGGSGTTRQISITQPANGKTVDVRIIQLALINATLNVYFYAGNGHSVRLMDSLILVSGNNYPIFISTYVNSSFYIERNQITSGNYWGIRFDSNGTSGVNVNANIYGNRITSSNMATSDGGIDFNFYGSASNHVRVRSNLIYKVAENQFTSAIRMNPQEFTNNDVKLFNNTIDNSLGNGLLVSSPSFFSHTDVVFNNNIVSNIAANWIQLPFTTPTLTASFDHNTYYLAGTAGYGGYVPGGDNDNQNPVYFNPANGDYRLGYPSPCINAGVGSINDVGFSDQLGWPRIIDIVPDRGAFESAGNPFLPIVSFNDRFDNGAIDQSYTYLKGTWIEDAESLLGNSQRKASMFFPDSVSCITCNVHFRVKSSGVEYAGVSPKMWVVLWYTDNKNYIDLLIKPESNKAILRQRVNGVIARKDKVDIVLEPFGGYSFDLEKSGSLLNLRKEDGTLTSIPLMGNFSGKFGFQAKGTYGYLSEFAVYIQ